LDNQRRRLIDRPVVSSSDAADLTSVRPEEWPPYYIAHVFCCVNERPPRHKRGCCAGKGSRQLCDYMCRRAMAMGMKNIRINHAGCLNRCELGPTMVIYPHGVWYTYSSEADVEEILARYIMKGTPVERLLLRPDEGPRH